jgi:predicted nucleic-acid-binding Zn-ribbon protein
MFMNSNRPNIDELIAALKVKGANKACARCGNTRFEIVGQTELSVQGQGEGIGSLYMQPVPVVIIACSHCGNLSQHSTGILTKKTARNWL